MERDHPAAPARATTAANIQGVEKARAQPMPVAKAAADPKEAVAREERGGRRRDDSERDRLSGPSKNLPRPPEVGQPRDFGGV